MASENVQFSEDLFDSEPIEQSGSDPVSKNLNETEDLFSGKTNKDFADLVSANQDTPDLFFDSEGIERPTIEEELPEPVAIEEDLEKESTEEQIEPVQEETYETDEDFEEEEVDKENEPEEKDANMQDGSELNQPEANTETENTEATDAPATKKPKTDIVLKDINLPLSKVKNIMKLDSEMNIVSHEAVVLVAKATEMFIQALTKESCKVKNPKKKTIQKHDFDQALTLVSALEFLEGALDWS